MTIRDAVIQKIKEVRFAAGPVTEETNLYLDLGFDSLSFINLLMQIEELFSVTIDIGEMQSCIRVGRLIEVVEAKKGSDQDD